MRDTTTPRNVIELDGKLWKPRRGATATPTEFIAAKATFSEVTEASTWNPWARDDRADEYHQAIEVMDQWRRAEPGHRILTTKQLEARWARQDREREKARERHGQE